MSAVRRAARADFEVMRRADRLRRIKREDEEDIQDEDQRKRYDGKGGRSVRGKDDRHENEAQQQKADPDFPNIPSLDRHENPTFVFISIGSAAENVKLAARIEIGGSPMRSGSVSQSQSAVGCSSCISNADLDFRYR